MLEECLFWDGRSSPSLILLLSVSVLFSLVTVSHISQPLPASEYHSYVFPGAEWGRESCKGALIHTVPFDHPSHVPALLDVLRHQAAINVLLASCFSNHNQLIGY